MAEINVNLYESSPEIKVDITATGPQGPKGEKGEKGESGGWSTEDLKKAVDTAFKETLEERSPLWTPDTAEVGQLLRVKTKNDDGSVILETVEMPSGVEDVKVAGESIVKDGVAEIPKASPNNYGVVKSVNSKGVVVNSQGILEFADGTNVKIDERSGTIVYWIKISTTLSNQLCPPRSLMSLE